MRNLLFAVAAVALVAAPATAALKTGDKAPDFTTTGAVEARSSSFTSPTSSRWR